MSLPLTRRNGSSGGSALGVDLEEGFSEKLQVKNSVNDSIKRLGGATRRCVQFSNFRNLRKMTGGLFVLFFILTLIAGETWYVILVVGICFYGALFSLFLCTWLLSIEDGTSEMRRVSEPIREGAEGFLHIQFRTVARYAIIVAICIVGSYVLRSNEASNASGMNKLHNMVLGLVTSFTFLLGAFCSASAGYISMWVSAHANIRVASCALHSYSEAFLVCFRGGAFSAILALTMCMSGITFVYGSCYLLFVIPGFIEATDVPLLLIGYGFGASFVALFMQLGGGIYTKAADVGADLSGKIGLSIPEDDPRNPAVIADLVGDMVGDCVGSSSDVFESVAAEIIGAMILGAALGKEAKVDNPSKFIFFPVVVHAFDILVSSIGILAVRAESNDNDEAYKANPLNALKKGYLISLILAFLVFIVTARWLLYTEDAPYGWIHFTSCGLVGMVTSYIFIISTQFYTDYEYPPVRNIAQASTTGHGTNIIVGLAYGMKSTVVPSVTVVVSVIASYHLGRTSGIGTGLDAGLFGTAVATMGMLSSAGFVLSMNNYGPIADNAGGIAEMSQQPERVRLCTDRLDAAGNVTKAITKGYSIGSAALACFLLFGAYMDEISQYSHQDFHSINIAIPEVLMAGLSIAAVGKTAGEVVEEVRRQLAAHPEIMEYKAKPDYRVCVEMVTRAALKEMIFPGMLAVLLPIAIGVVFRFIGESTERPLLGVEALGAYICFATLTGILMALFLDNVGGAWDNAKKYIEMGHFGGKNSEAHKAAVTGDTVGDPCKDTAGPALHVVIKLLSTTVLVAAPLFISPRMDQKNVVLNLLNNFD